MRQNRDSNRTLLEKDLQEALQSREFAITSEELRDQSLVAVLRVKLGERRVRNSPVGLR
jgi:hypothetical protein